MSAFRPASFGLMFLVALSSLLAGAGVRAGSGKELRSPAGIRMWLSETHVAPVISLRFAFAGGSADEPISQNGVARLLAGVLSEGAEGLEPGLFRQRVQRAGLRIRFQAGRDGLYGSVDMPAASLEEAVVLTGASMSHPRLDEQVLEKIKERTIADLDDSESDPRAIAVNAWYAGAFEHQTYGRSPDGRKSDIAGINREHIVAFHKKVLDRRRLSVVIAGPLSPEVATKAIDRIFADLPESHDTMPKAASFSGRGDIMLKQLVAGAAIAFGLPALPPGHRDHAAARIVTHILASGDLECRLVAELRERLGLVYGADASVLSDKLVAVMFGTMVTGSDKADAATKALRRTIADFAASGPSQDEVDTAKASLIGASLLALDSTSRLADAMLYALLDGDGPDFVTRRKQDIQDVSLADVRRVARTMLDDDKLMIVTASAAKN